MQQDVRKKMDGAQANKTWAAIRLKTETRLFQWSCYQYVGSAEDQEEV